MKPYEESYLRSVEEQVDRIRETALRRVQQIRPDIQYVVDRRTIDDYCDKIWDYPGVWYVSFTLPKGFRREEELISAIVEETLQYFSDQKQRKSPRIIFPFHR